MRNRTFELQNILTSIREGCVTSEQVKIALRSVDLEEIPALLASEEHPRVRSFGVRAVHFYIIGRGIRMGDEVEKIRELRIPSLLDGMLKEAGLSPRVTFFVKGLLVVLREEGWRNLLEELLDSAKEESEAGEVARMVLESIIRT